MVALFVYFTAFCRFTPNAKSDVCPLTYIIYICVKFCATESSALSLLCPVRLVLFVVLKSAQVHVPLFWAEYLGSATICLQKHGEHMPLTCISAFFYVSMQSNVECRFLIRFFVERGHSYCPKRWPIFIASLHLSLVKTSMDKSIV